MLKRGYEVYLPLIKTLRQWSDRKKKVEVPLIPSYIFVRVNSREYHEVIKTPGAVAFVTFEGKAARISENQMDTLKSAVDNSLNIEVDRTNLLPG